MALPRDLFWLQNLVDCGVPLKMGLLGAVTRCWNHSFEGRRTRPE